MYPQYSYMLGLLVSLMAHIYALRYLRWWRRRQTVVAPVGLWLPLVYNGSGKTKHPFSSHLGDVGVDHAPGCWLDYFSSVVARDRILSWFVHSGSDTASARRELFIKKILLYYI
nr:hypothetical protein Itr_chr13CG20420 [Ipomoea trifida]